jgi:hypothetical protein
VTARKGTRLLFEGPPNAEIAVVFKDPGFFDVKEFQTGAAAVTVVRDLPGPTEYECFLVLGGQRQKNPAGCPKGGVIEPDPATVGNSGN